MSASDTITWKPYSEPLRATLLRTFGIAVVVGTVLARASHGAIAWPVAVLIVLWPSFGGHWVELWFLNWLRPRISPARVVQLSARIALWFVAGAVFGVLMSSSAALITGTRHHAPPMWVAGLAFIGVELVAHIALQLRGNASVFNARG